MIKLKKLITEKLSVEIKPNGVTIDTHTSGEMKLILLNSPTSRVLFANLWLGGKQITEQ